MESLRIKETEKTPFVELNGYDGVFTFKGKSYPENVHETYAEIFNYLNLYEPENTKGTTLNMEWLYFNTASSKLIVKLLLVLKEKNPDLHVNWICESDFTMMIDKGEEFKEALGIDLKIVTV